MPQPARSPHAVLVDVSVPSPRPRRPRPQTGSILVDHLSNDATRRSVVEREPPSAALGATWAAEWALSQAFPANPDLSSNQARLQRVDAARALPTHIAPHHAGRTVLEACAEGPLPACAGRRLDRVWSPTPSAVPPIDEDPVLLSVVEDLARALGVETPEVFGGSAGRQRARAAGSRGVVERGAIFVDDRAADWSSRDGRTLLAHEVIHIAQDRLPTPSVAGAGVLAELEAHHLAERLATGAAVEVNHGLPIAHVAAESRPEAAQLDLIPQAVLDSAIADMEAALAELTGSFAYMELETAVEEEPSEADGPDEADEEAPAIDPDAALEGVREESGYMRLLGHRTMVDHGIDHPVVDELRSLFQDLFDSAAGLDPSALDLLQDALITDASDEPIHEAVATIDALIEQWPVDPVAVVPALAELPAPPDFGSEAPPPDADPAAVERESTPSPALEVPANPASDTPDPGSALLDLGAAAESSGGLDDGLQGGADFSAVAGEGAGLHLDRLPAIGDALVEGGLQGVVQGVGGAAFDVVVLERIAIVADNKLVPMLSESLLRRGAPKVPVVGPVIGLGMRVFAGATNEGGFSEGFYASELEMFEASVVDYEEAGQALQAAAEADGLAKGGHLLTALAELYELVGNTASILSGLSGLISAALFVFVAAACFATGGTAALTAPTLLALAAQLAVAATAFTLLTVWAWAFATMLHSAATVLLPEDEVAGSLDEITGLAQDSGQLAGGFIGERVSEKAADGVWTRAVDALGSRTAPEAPEPLPAGRPTIDGTEAATRLANAEADAQRKIEDTVERARALEDTAGPAPSSQSPGTIADTLHTLTTRTRALATRVHDTVVSSADRTTAGFREAARVAQDLLVGAPTSESIHQSAAAFHQVAEAYRNAHTDLTRLQDLEAQHNTATRDALNAMKADASSSDARQTAYQELDTLAAVQQDLRDARKALAVARDALQAAEADHRHLLDLVHRGLASDSDDGPDVRRSGSGSSTATGGVGSAMKALFDAIFAALSEATAYRGAVDARGAALDQHLRQLDDVPKAADSPEGTADTADLTVFLATPAPEGGAGLSDDLHDAISIRQAAEAATSPPTTTPDAVRAPLQSALAGERAFYEASVEAFVMGTAEATTTALLDRHPGAAPQPGQVQALEQLAHHRADQAERSRQTRDELQGKVDSAPAVPGDALASVAEGRELAATMGDLVSGGEAAATEPPRDLATDLADADTQTISSLDQLDQQADLLDTQHAEATSLAEEAEAQHTSFQADRDTLVGQRDAATAEREAKEAEAASHAAGAAADAGTATAGLRDLHSWAAGFELAVQ
jgi:hypothetical protein